jgi:hypothetical protein
MRYWAELALGRSSPGRARRVAQFPRLGKVHHPPHFFQPWNARSQGASVSSSPGYCFTASLRSACSDDQGVALRCRDCLLGHTTCDLQQCGAGLDGVIDRIEVEITLDPGDLLG